MDTFLDIVNRVSVNIDVKVSLKQALKSFTYVPKGSIDGYMVDLFMLFCCC